MPQDAPVSSLVVSNQTGCHKNLESIVAKHIRSRFDKPIADHTRQAFSELQQSVNLAEHAIILDSGCGTADSSMRLARTFPRHLVIGVDKSLHRLSKAQLGQTPNLRLLRADLIDFWRLLAAAKVQLNHHYLFYPNPWPKSKHLQRRWHGHPVFPTMIGLSNRLELRTNWKIYALEFAASIDYLLNTGYLTGKLDYKLLQPDSPMSAFERKYLHSGHVLHQVTFTLRASNSPA